MGTFDSHADIPNQIFLEGEEIALKFQQATASTGRVSWNIPPPALGCGADDQAYCGMLVTIDTVPSTPDTAPVDGVFYKDDPTADTNLHVGDKIGTSLVIGAFYEAIKKGNGEQLTTFFDITGLEPNTAYFVTGYAVDCVAQYHTTGARAYSPSLGASPFPEPEFSLTGPTSPGYQMIGFNPTPASVSFDADLLEVQGSGQFFGGIIPTDGTDLVFGTEYEFTFYKDQFETSFKDPGNRITLLGENAATYEELIDELNRQFVLAIDAPHLPQAPNTGVYFWDGDQLFQFDGESLVEQDVIIEATDPANRNTGDYWFDGTVLNQWDGAAWIVQVFISFDKDPTNPDCDDYWFDGTTIFRWDGNVWCETEFCIQTNDPSEQVFPDCADYWYDESTMLLQKWNDRGLRWEPVNAVMWPVDPNNPVTGSYWFDEDDEILYVRNVPVPSIWNAVDPGDYFVMESAPFPAAPGQLWIQQSTETLFERNTGNTDWVPIEPIFFQPLDPTDRESCDLWWQTGVDTLRVWNTQNDTWVTVNKFTISTIDPALAPVLTPGKVWYNPDNMCLQYWDGNCWIKASFIFATFDPIVPPIGTERFDTTLNQWFVWNGTSWDEIDPIDSPTDPNVLALGVFWYDTTTDSLFQWNGTTFVPILFTTVDPRPVIGQLYYDSINEVALEWNGIAWVEKLSDCYAFLDECGNIFLVSRTIGSESSFAINKDEPLTLFEALMPTANILPPVQGGDAVSGTPGYDRLGCGTDGTPDERRELGHSLRAQLGYPTVEVELTTYQMEEAIQSALEDFRLRSSGAYKRAFFFLDLRPGFQRYILTNERVGYHCIVNIMDIRRLTSAFLTTAFGSGAYGQVVLQHLYNMGTFDLLSYDLVSQYIEQLEVLFASRMTWHWDESSRALDIYQTISGDERVLVDATIERTEQELLTDRWAKSWLERRALAECRYMLAEVRGKYGSLPGAGGGVQLNAAELISRADADMQMCMDDIDNFVVQDPEDLGQGTTFVIG